MQRIKRIERTALLVVALLASFFFDGTARAQSQSPAYVGKFTLTYQIHWGNSVLQPGNYTISIKSTGDPIIALVRKADGDAVTYVLSGARSDRTNGVNALLMKEKGGQLTVHSMAIADLGMVLIYDPSLARETVQEARVSQTVPVQLAKK